MTQAKPRASGSNPTTAQINPLTKSPILQRLQWVIDPVGYMESAAQQQPDIFSAEIIDFGADLVFVHNPQAIQYILTSDRKELSAPGEINEILAPLTGNTSLFLLSGHAHRRQRQLLMPSFHGERMRSYAQLITDLTEQTMNQLSVGQSFIARSTMQAVSLEVILQAVFGVREGDRYLQLRDLTRIMSDGFSAPISSSVLFFKALQKDWGNWTPWGRFLRLRQQVDNLLFAEIADRRAYCDPNRTDILSLMIAARDENGNSMSDQELRDELITLMLAGQDTTVSALSWALYWIHSLPHVREKLLLELDSADTSDLMNLTKLPYLSAICQETLRIHPIAMLTFPRRVEQPIELLGYRFKPGTVFVGCIYLVHQRPDIYPNPKQFKPERFLENKFSGSEFLPFGGGARRCIGEALAIVEMKLILATLLSRYELALTETKPVLPKRRGVTLAPAGGVRMRMLGKRA
ncbi:cytochrome P450 [Phormidium tenue FACHB-886]|nr:cytochrome P450 [Phormidium tenue FACHB-886]